jgi:hypothetical protein
MSSWHSVSVQGKIYLYAEDNEARTSKDMEVFCIVDDIVMVIAISPLSPELNSHCNVWGLEFKFHFFMHALTIE